MLINELVRLLAKIPAKILRMYVPGATLADALPRDLAARVHVRTARDGALRAPLLDGAEIFVPGIEGLASVLLEAKAAGCASTARRCGWACPKSR